MYFQTVKDQSRAQVCLEVMEIFASNSKMQFKPINTELKGLFTRSYFTDKTDKKNIATPTFHVTVPLACIPGDLRLQSENYAHADI